MPEATLNLPPDPVATTAKPIPSRGRAPWLSAAVAVVAEGLPFTRSRSSADVRDRNAYRLYADLLWSSIFSAVAAFNGAYAVRLGASNELVGLLNSLPFLVVALLTIPFSRVVKRSTNRVRLVARSVLAHRAGFVLVALLPLLLSAWHAEAFVAVTVLMTIPASLVNITFHCLFAEVVPESSRATVISVRMIIASGVVTVLTPLFGWWLDVARFPANYQVIYLVGFLTSLFAMRALARIEAPEASPTEPADEAAAPSGLRERLAASWRLVAGERAFARILLNTLLQVAGNWISTPLYVIYYVRVLGATDGWIGTLTAVASLTAMVGYEFWRRFIARRGDSFALRISIVLSGFYPLAVALSQDLSVILVLAAANGLVLSGLNTSHYSVLLRTCPAEQRPTYMAIFVTTMNAGAFVSPMIGVALASAVGIQAAIAVGGLLWIVGGALFWVLPVRPKGEGEARTATMARQSAR